MAEPPVFDPATGEDAHLPDEGTPQPVVWRVEHDVLGRETRAVIEHGTDYEAEHGSKVEERYEGSVGVSTTDPGNAWARARSAYRITWPDADCRAEARLDLRSDATAYHVVVDVTAEEVGGELGRHERRFERTIPRRFQ